LSDKAIKGVTGLSKNVMAHIEEGKQMCDPIFKNDKCQATNEDKCWGYFSKINSLSPIIVVA
jgi:hypothetical protein